MLVDVHQRLAATSDDRPSDRGGDQSIARNPSINVQLKVKVLGPHPHVVHDVLSGALRWVPEAGPEPLGGCQIGGTTFAQCRNRGIVDTFAHHEQGVDDRVVQEAPDAGLVRGPGLLRRLLLLQAVQGQQCFVAGLRRPSDGGRGGRGRQPVAEREQPEGEDLLPGLLPRTRAPGHQGQRCHGGRCHGDHRHLCPRCRQIQPETQNSQDGPRHRWFHFQKQDGGHAQQRLDPGTRDQRREQRRVAVPRPRGSPRPCRSGADPQPPRQGRCRMLDLGQRDDDEPARADRQHCSTQTTFYRPTSGTAVNGGSNRARADPYRRGHAATLPPEAAVTLPPRTVGLGCSGAGMSELDGNRAYARGRHALSPPSNGPFWGFRLSGYLRACNFKRVVLETKGAVEVHAICAGNAGVERTCRTSSDCH